MANPENKQLPYESTQKDIRDGIDGASAKLTTTELTPRNLADVLAEEIKALTTVVGGLNFINCVVVAQLPTTGISTTTIYLVPKSPAQQDNVYDEYINLDGTVNGWEKIGDTEIDLSNYYTKTETDTLLNGKVDTVAGMGLSHNDFTDTEKTKLSGIESGAEVNVQSDWNQTDNTADDYIKNKPSSEVKSATDTFTTVNGGLLEECIINLEPVQSGSGDPSPDNIRPISGHTEVDLQVVGKNLFGFGANAVDKTADYRPTGNQRLILTNSGLNTLTFRYNNGNWSTGFIEIDSLDGTVDYSISYKIKDNNSSYTPMITKDVRSDSTKLILNIYGGNGSTAVSSDYHFTLYDIQIEYGTSATSYEPYLGHLYQVQIGSTVYGGYVDLVSGELTVTSAKYQYSDAPVPTTKDAYNRWIISYIFTSADNALNDIIGKGWNATTNYEWYSSELPITIVSSSEASCSFYGHSDSVEYRIRIPDTYTAEQAQQIARDNVIIFQINPTTLSLTPQQIETLAGQNNLSTPLSGQSIETNGVEYKELFTFADVKSYVDNKIPDAPTTDGTYTLTATVSGGVPTYSWT